MNVPSNFSFYNVRKTLPQGEYEGKIVDFTFLEKTSRAGNPYTSLSAKVEIGGQNYFVNLSLDPAEKGKATHNLIQQLSIQTGKSMDELLELCANPVDFFNLAKDKVVKLISTEKGYLDVWTETPPKSENTEYVDPSSVPF